MSSTEPHKLRGDLNCRPQNGDRQISTKFLVPHLGPGSERVLNGFPLVCRRNIMRQSRAILCPCDHGLHILLVVLVVVQPGVSLERDPHALEELVPTPRVRCDWHVIEAGSTEGADYTSAGVGMPCHTVNAFFAKDVATWEPEWYLLPIRGVGWDCVVGDSDVGIITNRTVGSNAWDCDLCVDVDMCQRRYPAVGEGNAVEQVEVHFNT